MKPDISVEELKKHDQKLFDEYCKTLQILSESTDDYLYISKLTEDRIYYWGSIADRYPLEPSPKDGYTGEEYARIVYDHDAAALEEDLRRIMGGTQDTHDMEYRLVDREGSQVWISCRGKVVYDEYGRRLFMMGRISDTALLDKTDSMTGLLNAAKFREDFDQTLKQDKEGTLLVLGLDDFKAINRKYGRTHGNSLLKNITLVMEDCIDDKFRVYRLDGDHFAINCIGYHQEMVRSVYERIQEQVGDGCSFSAGAVSYPLTDVHDVNTICQYAESALDHAKKAGKNQLVFFSIEDYAKQLYLIDLTDEMRRSVENNCEGFFLYYQPQIAMDSMEVKGAEALLRYRSAYYGVVSPEMFIATLEQTGMIVPVGNWVLKEAVRQCREWRKYNPDFRISINISYVQLQQKTFANTVCELLDQIGLPGEAVTLELTESRQLQDYSKYNQVFIQLGRRGIQVSIDDFGTGYFGLSFVRSLAIGEIKIDRSFISNIQQSAYNYRLMENVVELAHSVQIRVCCEGVETVEELHMLEGLTPETAQGFYFSKPVSPKEFERRFLLGSGQQDIWKKNMQAEVSEPAVSQDWKEDIRSENIYKEVLDQFEELITVIDTQTNEICYMNEAAKRLAGVNSYRGRICYELLRKEEQPCKDCNNYLLDTTGFVTNELPGYIQGGKKLMKKKLIRWNGRNLRLEIGYDLSSAGHAQANLGEKLKLDEYMIESLTELFGGEDMRSAINCYLQKAGEFYKAERSYLFICSETDGTWCNACEWCENQVESQQVKLLTVPEEIVAPWIEAFQEDHALIVPNIDVYKESAPETWKILRAQNIRRVIEMPLMHDGKLLGFIGVDNPKEYSFDGNFFERTAPFVAKMFVRASMPVVQEELVSEISDIIRGTNIVKDMQIGMWIIEIDNNMHISYMYADNQMRDLLGADTAMSGEETYQHWYGRIADGYQEYVNDAVREMMISGKTVELEYPWNHPVRGEVPVRCVGRLSKSEKGVDRFMGYHLITQDMIYKHVSKGEAIKRQYVRKEDFYQAILSETAAYAEVDLQSGLMLNAGGMWEDCLAKEKEKRITFQDLQNKYMRGAVAAEDCKGYFQHLSIDRIRHSYDEGVPTVSYQFRCKMVGDYHWMELFVHAFREPGTDKMYALFYLKDINDKMLRNLENERAATTDALTNVLNRKSFEERTVRYMREDARDREACALLIFDIDNFKNINDTLGHQGGDEVLRAFAATLQETFRRTDYIGRFGGDEFVVFLKNYVSTDILDQRLKEFQEKLRNHKPLAVYCSIGVAVARKEQFDYERCLNRADEALYISKNNGKNRFCYRTIDGKEL